MQLPDDAKHSSVSSTTRPSNIVSLLVPRLLVLILFQVAAASSAEKHNVMAPLNHSEQSVLIGEDIIKPRCDKLEYRSITLPNKLRVLLISDPETDKAAAALNVSCWPLSWDTQYMYDPMRL